MEEAGRALVIAFNKWDLTDEERRRYLRREIERELVQFEWAAKINISALTVMLIALVRRSRKRWLVGRPESQRAG